MDTKTRLAKTWQARNVPLTEDERRRVAEYFELHPELKKGHFFRAAVLEKIARETKGA